MLRAINGSLNWLAGQLGPDLAAQTSFSQQRMSNPTVHQLSEVNIVIRRAKQHADMSIRFVPFLLIVCHWCVIVMLLLPM